jgi:sugar lactone lactonase YvrE
MRQSSGDLDANAAERHTQGRHRLWAAAHSPKRATLGHLLGRAGGLGVICALGVVCAVALALPAPTHAAAPGAYFFVSAVPTYFHGTEFWGSGGPAAAAVDSAGNVYVSEPHGLNKFTADGTWMCSYYGDGGFSLGSCYGLDVDAAGNVYVCEIAQNRITKLAPNANGVNATSYHRAYSTGTAGVLPGQFNAIRDVAVDDATGYLFVTDMTNDTVQRLRPNDGAARFDVDRIWGEYGSGDGFLSGPYGIAADGAGHVFVADQGNARIQEFTTAGLFVRKWGTRGTGTGQFMSPQGLDVDDLGNLWVTDYNQATSWVVKHAPQQDGSYSEVARFGGWGTANGQFKFPWDVSVAASGYVYVTDTQNCTLKRFAWDAGTPVSTLSGVPAGWTKADVPLTLGAADPPPAGPREYSSGVARVEYSLDGGATWTAYASPLVLTAEGDTAFSWRAVDHAGNTENARIAHVLIDRTGPRTYAAAKATVRRGKKVTLRYRVVDRTPKAKVMIVVKRRGKTFLTRRLGWQTTGTAHVYRFRCRLARGTYRYLVYAGDQLGTAQVAPVGWKRLIVK